jgi:hypothetical protein
MTLLLVLVLASVLLVLVIVLVLNLPLAPKSERVRSYTSLFVCGFMARV